MKRPHFFYKGPMESSKSLFNRALIVQSFFSELEIEGNSNCHDVQALQNSLRALKNGDTEFYCGSGGTTFRFLLARLSRIAGTFTLHGTQRLFTRPQQGLLQALTDLGCEFHWRDATCLQMTSQGWRQSSRENFALSMNTEVSSQFASALILASWNLNKPFVLTLQRPIETGTYLDMTLQLLRTLGMNWQMQNTGSRLRLVVPTRQRLCQKYYKVEPDMSSAFAVAAFAIFNGRVEFRDFPEQSLQPDSWFLDGVSQLGARVVWSERSVDIEKAQQLRPIEIDLAKTPDLFPVLSVLLSRAEGTSTLTGLTLLRYKESDRLARVQELLSALGVKHFLGEKGLSIQGQSHLCYPPHFEFSPDQDHRIAMAAALAQFQGADIHILNRSVVNKSFPAFWDIVASQSGTQLMTHLTEAGCCLKNAAGEVKYEP